MLISFIFEAITNDSSLKTTVFLKLFPESEFLFNSHKTV